MLFHTIRSAADINFSEDLPPGVQTQFAASLLDLLAATIQMQMAGSDSAASERERLLGSAKQYVESHLDDPQLTVDRIAIALRVSERTLTRMFAESGTTPMRWVWQRRLESAYCSLKEGRARQVTEAAFRHGFTDVSHFSRIFKLCYGHSPKDLLSRTRRGAAPGRQPAGARPGVQRAVSFSRFRFRVARAWLSQSSRLAVTNKKPFGTRRNLLPGTHQAISSRARR